MDSGHRPRTTATTVAAPETSVPSPRSAPAVESAAPDITPVGTATVDTATVDTATVDTGPIPLVPAARPVGTVGGGVATAPAVEAPADPLADTGPIPVVAGAAPVVDPPVTTPVTQPCRCGHDRDAHEHFRRGTDCATCDCGRFRTPGLLARLRG